MQKITSIINNRQGSAIIVALIILVLLTVIGIAATNTSTTEVQISTNALLNNVAFYTADSGIEAGRAALNDLKSDDVGSWDILLSNAADPDNAVEIERNGTDCTTLDDIIDADGDANGGRTVGPATFTLTIEDNEDLDGSDTVDSDNTIILISTLVAPYRNATATIRTTVRGGQVNYAQDHYNAGNSSVAATESETASTTVRW
jgi:type IV pilus assembly protein PilX